MGPSAHQNPKICLQPSDGPANVTSVCLQMKPSHASTASEQRTRNNATCLLHVVCLTRFANTRVLGTGLDRCGCVNGAVQKPKTPRQPSKDSPLTMITNTAASTPKQAVLLASQEASHQHTTSAPNPHPQNIPQFKPLLKLFPTPACPFLNQATPHPTPAPRPFHSSVHCKQAQLPHRTLQPRNKRSQSHNIYMCHNEIHMTQPPVKVAVHTCATTKPT